MGRQRNYIYTEELGNEICDAIENSSLGVRGICKINTHFPPARVIRSWFTTYPLFGEQYARAKAAQIENLADEIIEIADNTSRDVFEGSDGQIVINSGAINRDRLRIDSRKWTASKLLPKVYGDKKDTDDKDETDFISKNRDKLNNK